MTDDYSPFEEKISREDFESRVKSKVREFQGLLTREGAITILASELGIELSNKPSDIRIKVSDIIEGTINIDLVGKVTRISEPKEFVRKTSGMNGKVQRLEIADESGSIPLVLWDEKVDDAAGIKVGDVVSIIAGFAKKGLNDRLELTLQRRGNIEPSDEIIDVKERRPERVEIGFLKEDTGDLKIVGSVASVSDVREYERDGRSFKVCSLFLKDNTGQVRVSLWNENADKMAHVSVGDIIEVENCYSRRGLNGIEIQTNSYTRLDLNPDIDGLSLPTIDSEVKVSDITSDMQFFTVCGTVNRVFDTRSFERDDGSLGIVTSMELDDGSGTCRVSLWDDKAKAIQSIPEGTVVVIEGCRAREGLDGVEISLGRSGRLMPRLPDIEQYSPGPTGLARVAEVKNGAIKASSKEGELVILTDEQTFSPGDLIHYVGTMEGENIRAKSVTASKEEYPTLDELTSPPRISLKELAPERIVNLHGIARHVTQVRDYNMVRLDDGTSIVTGYCHDEGLDEGCEYSIVARTFSNGDRVEFFARSADSIDDVDEAYRLLQMF